MSQNTTHKNCLILNADYSPLSIIDYRKAIALIFKDNCSALEVIHFYEDDYVVGVKKNFSLPAVIRIKQFLSIHGQQLNFSRKNLFIRDNFCCQYCGKMTEKNKLTYDHVIPKSQWRLSGSPTTWTNIVLACVDCNRKKGNRTPEQARMKLINTPIRPCKSKKYLSVTASLLNISKSVPSEWKLYIS